MPLVWPGLLDNFRNVGEVILDNVTFSTTSPDDRNDVYTDNIGRIERLP